MNSQRNYQSAAQAKIKGPKVNINLSHYKKDSLLDHLQAKPKLSSTTAMDAQGGMGQAFNKYSEFPINDLEQQQNLTLHVANSLIPVNQIIEPGTPSSIPAPILPIAVRKVSTGYPQDSNHFRLRNKQLRDQFPDVDAISQKSY